MLLNLRSNNPFSYGVITTFEDNSEVLDTFRLNLVPSPLDKIHTIIYGDTLDLVAFDYYGDSKYWWVLFYVNNLDNPFILETNSVLIIPDLLRIKAAIL